MARAKKNTDVTIPITKDMRARNTPSMQPMVLEQDDTKRDFIAKSLGNILAVSKAFDEPVKTDEELCARLTWFFENCVETRQLPTVEKMCLAIGYPRETVFEIINGIRKGFSTDTPDILKKAKNLIASLDAELAQEGKIQPVVYLFRAKNFYNMRDQQEMVLTPNNRLSEVQDRKAIEAKYADLPED